MIDPGKMRHRIRIEQYNGERDGHGDVLDSDDENWTPVCTVWASVSPLSGREFYEAGQSQSEVTHKLRLRYRPGIKTEMRIVYGSRIFAILSIIDWEERHESLLIMAKELVE